MVAGPNGSGKTTLTDQLRQMNYDVGEYINADDIARDLPGEYALQVAAAQAEAERRRQTCIAERRSFTFETVMSHPSKVALLRQARHSGFATVLYFVATETPDLNVARVAQRVALKGHAVPEDRIRNRYTRALGLLIQAMAEADRVVLFDNSYRASAGQQVVLTPFLEQLRNEGVVTTNVHPPVPEWWRRTRGAGAE